MPNEEALECSAPSHKPKSFVAATSEAKVDGANAQMKDEDGQQRTRDWRAAPAPVDECGRQ